MRPAGSTRNRPQVGKVKWDPLRVVIFLLMILIVSRVNQLHPIFVKLRPALLFNVLAVGIALLNPRLLADSSWTRLKPARLVGGIAALTLLSIPFGLSMGGAGQAFLDHFVRVLIFTGLLMSVMRGAGDLRMFAWSYVLASGLLVVLSLFVFGVEAGQRDLMRLSSDVQYDANDMSLMLLIGLVFALMLFSTSSLWGKVLNLVIMAGIMATMTKAGSRGGLIGLAAVGVALLVLVRGVPLRWRMGAVIGAFAGLMLTAPPGYWEQMRTIIQPGDDYNVSASEGRIELAKRGLGYMMDRPVFGVGLGNYGRADALSAAAERALAGGEGRWGWRPAHNSFVQAGAEAGVPGLVIWTALVWAGIAGPLRLRRRLPAYWRRADRDRRLVYAAASYLPVAFIGFGVSSFFLSFAWEYPLYIMAAFVTGLYVSARRLLVETPGISVPSGDLRHIPAPQPPVTAPGPALAT